MDTEWIASYQDGTSLQKISVFIRGIFNFSFKIFSSKTVIIHLALGTSAIRKLLFFIPAWLLGKKIILHFHTPGMASSSPEDMWKVKWMFQMADKVIVLSESWKRLIQDEFNNSISVTVVENPAPIISQDILKQKRIVFVGTLDDRKGYKTLLEAFALMKESSWSLDICGDGDMQNAELMVERLGISEKVVFHGWVNSKRRNEILNSAAIFCLPSYAEGLPMALLEAMAFRCVLITTPVGGIPNYLQHGLNAIMIQPGNVNELSNALEEATTDDLLRERLVNESLNIYHNYFHPRVVERKYERALFGQ